MIVITSNPIIEEKDFLQDDWFNVVGENSRRRRTSRKNQRSRDRSRKRAQKGTFGQRLSSGIQKIADSGILDSASQLAMGNQQRVGDGMDMGFDMPPPPPPPPSGMSRGAKIAIGVAVAALVGVGVYFLVLKKKK
jgi:hypothetical protein